jgi:hypothetical protein
MDASSHVAIHINHELAPHRDRIFSLIFPTDTFREEIIGNTHIRMAGHVFKEGFPHSRDADGSLFIELHPFAIQGFNAKMLPSKPPIIAVEIDPEIKSSNFRNTQ